MFRVKAVFSPRRLRPTPYKSKNPDNSRKDPTCSSYASPLRNPKPPDPYEGLRYCGSCRAATMAAKKMARQALVDGDSCGVEEFHAVFPSGPFIRCCISYNAPTFILVREGLISLSNSPLHRVPHTLQAIVPVDPKPTLTKNLVTLTIPKPKAEYPLIP